jgi:hypothetical protein
LKVADTVATATDDALNAARGADEAFHYTYSKYVDSIRDMGLRPGSYATLDGKLSPVQAQIDLALPPNRGLTNALLRIDMSGMAEAGFKLPKATRVKRDFGMPGGGTEIKFPYAVPPDFIKVVEP